MSIPATSQILNSKGSYRPETRERVLAAARKLGYQPNIYAQAMTRRSFGTYALVLSSNPSSSLMPRGLLEGLDAALSPRGLHLVMAFLPDHRLTDAGSVPKILSHVLADGLLINYNAGYPAEAVRLLSEKGVPSVWLNVDHARNAVHPDDVTCGRHIAELFTARGHRRLAWFDMHVGPGERGMHYSSAARRNGFLTAEPAARVLGLPYGASEDVLSNHLHAVLAAPDRPTAIACYGVHEGHLVLIEAMRLGLACPRDLSVVVVSDRSESFGALRLDTMVLDSVGQAAAAAAMLGRLISGERDLDAVPVPLRHVAGQSLGACRR